MDSVVAGRSTDRKLRGAFYTPSAIANFLARWAIAGQPGARVLDPTCGEGVFLLAAAQQLRDLGSPGGCLGEQVYGVDMDEPSLRSAKHLLAAEGLAAHLIEGDFFGLPAPGDLLATLPEFDAVLGNPPFVRYQNHTGTARRRAAGAALTQGVRLSGLASSWAALLVHSGGFLKPDGRLAMVIPAELLTVGYAEPVRRWLRRRFAAVKLVLFERLQFAHVLEDVVLVLAHGTGGCDAFSLYYVEDAEDLYRIQPFDEFAITLSEEGKWTDMLLSVQQRQTFKHVVGGHFVGLGSYGPPELGTVTGANGFFVLTEDVRREFGLIEGRHVRRVSPPGTRHFRGLRFTGPDWQSLRRGGEAVWILYPEGSRVTAGLARYLARGEQAGVPEAYKCRIRTPWWRPPVVRPPDLFFTYMSHRYPRLVTNEAGVTFVNSMHGIRLRPDLPPIAKVALPLLAMNSVTMLGAEVYGRSYGGGVLKMEPREASVLPVPAPAVLERAWAVLQPGYTALDRQLREGRWAEVVARVDEILLRETLGLDSAHIKMVTDAVATLRSRRLARSSSPAGSDGARLRE